MTGTEPQAWGTGLMDDITFVGLDVHKATVCIAVAEGRRGGEVRQLGVFENRPEILSKVVSRLGTAAQLVLRSWPLRSYGLHRLLTGYGHECALGGSAVADPDEGGRLGARHGSPAMR